MKIKIQHTNGTMVKISLLLARFLFASPHAIQEENENDIRTENEIENEIGKGPKS